MKDKKNILIAVLVIFVLALLVPGFIGSVIRISWGLFKFVVIALALIIIISLVLKKKRQG